MKTPRPEKYDSYDIAIIGGGAAGLTAAVFAARAGKSVVILEKNSRVGKKLLTTGNGRCNLTNISLDYNWQLMFHPEMRSVIENKKDELSLLPLINLSHFYTSSYIGLGGVASPQNETAVLRKIFTSVEPAREFFKSLGVKTVVEQNGLVYPHSNSASSVLDALRIECKKYGVVENTSFFAKNISGEDGNFLVSPPKDAILGKKPIRVKKIVISVGSPAKIAIKKSDVELITSGLGNDETGGFSVFSFAHELKIKSTPFYPVLCPIKTLPEMTLPLKNLRVRASCRIVKDKKILATETGEVQFGDGYLSGICILNLSRMVYDEYVREKTLKLVTSLDSAFGESENDGVKTDDKYVSLDLTPDLALPNLIEFIDKTAKIRAHAPLEDLLTGFFHKRVCIELLKKAIPTRKTSEPTGDLSYDEIKKLAGLIKDWQFPITSVSGWEQAQISGGGILLTELNMNLEAKAAPGVFIAGEAVDIHADCGGYNLSWAWASGEIAGKYAAKGLEGVELTEES